VLLLAIPVLSYVGYREVRTSRQGQVIDAVTDPAAPGFEATVVPTPTMMVADTNADGALNGVVILSLGPEDQGGSVTSVPVGTVVPLPLTELGSGNFQEIYQLSGVDGLTQRVATMATAALPEKVEVGVDQWATLLAPVGPLTVDNPAPIVDLAGAQIFPQGEVQVAPEQAGAFLTGGGPFDGGLTRTERQMAFWEAWITKVAEVGGPDAVPGETDRGLGRFVRGLAAGTHSVIEFPVTAVPIPGAAAADTTVFEPATDDIPSFIATNIPFPSGVGRARTRILDGVGQTGLTSEAASLIVPAMAEIHSVGNDDEFGQATTRIVYFDDEDREAAERFQTALGVGELVEGEAGSDSIDVTITLGDDFGDAGAAEPGAADTVPTADSTTTTAAIAPGTPGGPTDTSGGVVPDTGFTVPPATVPADDSGSGNPNEL
jgi:hypothetical protein